MINSEHIAPLTVSAVIAGAMVVLALLPGCGTTESERLYAAATIAEGAQQAALTYLQTKNPEPKTVAAIKAASATLTAALDAAMSAETSGDNAAEAAALAAAATAATDLQTLLK